MRELWWSRCEIHWDPPGHALDVPHMGSNRFAMLLEEKLDEWLIDRDLQGGSVRVTGKPAEQSQPGRTVMGRLLLRAPGLLLLDPGDLREELDRLAADAEREAQEQIEFEQQRVAEFLSVLRSERR